MTSPRITRILSATAFMLGSFALAALAGSWTAPTDTPPNGNIDAPINVGSGLQTRNGPLILNYLNSAPDDIGLKISGKLQMVDGNQSAGKVLISDANGVGSWQTPSQPPNTIACSSASTFGLGVGGVILSLVIDGRNICTDDNGCSIQAIEYISSTNEPVASFSYRIPFTQMGGGASANKWMAAVTNGYTTGTNGDNTSTTILASPISIVDDISGVETSPNSIVVNAPGGNYYVKASVCDI